MARRKDHTPEELKGLLLQAAEKIVYSKGMGKLTARALAAAVGYTPGTIYNVYKDMDDLILDINYATLGRLQDYCREKMRATPADFSRIRALAYAYVDFARENIRAWETIFAHTRKRGGKPRLPKHYQQRLGDIFRLIEDALQECLGMQADIAGPTARLVWASLHGITVLTLDGSLGLIGVDDPHPMIDDLLRRCLVGGA